ncbi:MAG TPA: poly(R)-hydroxyalkanoic acid synthase subunit PhaE [Povalibacter sp.]
MVEGDSGSAGQAWFEGWIEQQRELLRRQSSAEPAADGSAVHDLAQKWRELGNTWLSGLTEFARKQSAGNPDAADPSVTPFGVGEEFVETWRNAWTIASGLQQGATQGLSDLLGRLPPLGLAREHTEAWRELAAAQIECAQHEQELRAVLLKVHDDALNLLRQRAQQRESSGKPIASYRDLYDLWVECAEHVYAEVAHSDAYSKLQAQLGNATMRLRSRQQRIAEYSLRQLDLPTRSEINSVHQQLRQLKQRLALLDQGQPRSVAKPRKTSVPKSKRSVAKKAKGRKR